MVLRGARCHLNSQGAPLPLSLQLLPPSPAPSHTRRSLSLQALCLILLVLRVLLLLTAGQGHLLLASPTERALPRGTAVVQVQQPTPTSRFRFLALIEPPIDPSPASRMMIPLDALMSSALRNRPSRLPPNHCALQLRNMWVPRHECSSGVHIPAPVAGSGHCPRDVPGQRCVPPVERQRGENQGIVSGHCE